MQHKKPSGPTPKQNKMIQEAVALHQSGHLDAAETQYKKLLKYLPSNIDLLNNLGMIAFQKGLLEDGVRIIERSLQINPNQPYSLNNYGNALKDLKRLDKALVIYDRAIALKPDYAVAYSNRGLVLHDLDRLDDALQSYDLAITIKPDYAVAFFNRGIVLQELNQLDEALESFDCAIAHNPNYAVALFNRGIALQDLKRQDEALVSYDRAIDINSDYADAHYNRGLALQDLKRQDEALVSYDRAIAIKPDYAVAYTNRGNALQDLKRLDEALASYDRAIAIKPDYAVAYSNRGNALQDLKRLDEALASFDCAITLKPDYAEAHYNLGLALQDVRRLDEALASYDRAIILKPDLADAYWNKSLLKILNGDYLQGWQLYEWRWKKEPLIDSLRVYKQPLWLGSESLLNKTLLIYPEQGFGDYIQCVRYAALVEQLGANVILETPLALMSLVSTLKGQFTLVESGNPLPDFDYHCPVMSLPLAFKTTVETIPAQLPYLYADKDKKQHWQEKLGKKTVTRIGLIWSGSTGHKNDHNRSLLLQQLASLLELPVEFHSLQKEIRAVDIKTLTDFPHIHQHQEDLLDFSDTAALVDAMDIIISVDTSVAHLAGAMGKKVCVLLPYAPDYRWMLDRTDCLWYPTATLFRQPTIDDWESVAAEIREVVIKFAGEFTSEVYF